MPGELDKRFMIERQGKAFALYAGLLDLAHQEGLVGIRTQLIQMPSPDNGNVAVCTAEVTLEFRDNEKVRTKTFTGIGDASPDNVARMMVPHILRMAETRAKARALRDAVNIGVAALEELGGDDDEQPIGRAGHQDAAPPRQNLPNARPPASVQHPRPAAPNAPVDPEIAIKIPDSLKTLSSYLHTSYRDWWTKVTRCTEDSDLAAIDGQLQEANGKRSIHPALYAAVMQLIVEQSGAIAAAQQK